MPRVQSDDYDTKRSLIMDKAAKLFADQSYPSARMMDIAKACGASKSMLYHYFPKKEDLLYAILTEHLEEVVEGIKELHSSIDSSWTNYELVESFVELFVKRSSKARSRHLVAMLDVKYLPKKQQTTVKSLERDIIKLAADILKEANPKLRESDYTLYALLLIGTINSMDIWRRPSGHYSAEDLSEKVTHLFLDGFLDASK